MRTVMRNHEFVTAESFMSLIKSVGWSDGTKLSLDGLSLAIESCTSHYSVWQDQELIAFARVLSDRYLFSTIPEVIVRPEHQKSGLGKAIMECIIEDYGDTILYFGAQPGNEEFFEKLGFKKGMQSYGKRFRPHKKKTD